MTKNTKISSKMTTAEIKWMKKYIDIFVLKIQN